MPIGEEPVQGLRTSGELQSLNRNRRYLTLLVLARNARDDIVFKQAGGTLVGAELDVTLRAEGRVRSDGQAKQLAVLDKGLLGKVRVELNLENLGFDTGVAVNVKEDRALAVATQTPRSSVDEFFDTK